MKNDTSPWLYLARPQFALLYSVWRARCFVADRLQWVGTAARSASRIASRQTCPKTQIVTAQGIAKTTTLIGLIAAMNLMVAMPTASAADKLADLSSVLGELRMGGFVIYFRHGATDQAGSADEAADLMKCETQRNLSAEGRKQAIQIGKEFQSLGIPVGTVTTSPFCRCKDTAELAFGHFTVSNDLYFAIGTSASETNRFTESLRRMLSTPPAKATNAVIVSHTANLREATGIWPKPEGVAYVFRPLPGDKFEAIAMVLPEDWDKVAKLKSSSKFK